MTRLPLETHPSVEPLTSISSRMAMSCFVRFCDR